MPSAALKGHFFTDFLSAFKESQSPVGASPDGSSGFIMTKVSRPKLVDLDLQHTPTKTKPSGISPTVLF
jgi:hypothetical protein